MANYLISLYVAPPHLDIVVTTESGDISFSWDNQNPKPIKTLNALIEDIVLLNCERKNTDMRPNRRQVSIPRTYALYRRTLHQSRGAKYMRARRGAA